MSELLFPHPPLAASGIVLRPWRIADAGAIVAACQDPLIPRFNQLVPSPYSRADALGWLLTHEPQRLAGTDLQLAVASAESGEPLGAIAAHVFSGAKIGRLGYWLAAQARGSGHMTTAVKLLTGWLFEVLEVGRVELTTAPENFASQSVASRCGFRQEGLLRAYLYNPHLKTRSDALMWGLLPGELAE